MLTINPVDHGFIQSSYRFYLIEVLYRLDYSKEQSQEIAAPIKKLIDSQQYNAARLALYGLVTNPPERTIPTCSLCGRPVDECGGEYRIAVDDYTCRNMRRATWGGSRWLPY